MDYIYIRAWHRMTGSFAYYIEDQVDKAREDKAPQTAIYFDRYANRWVTLEECVERTQERVKFYIKNYFKIDV